MPKAAVVLVNSVRFIAETILFRATVSAFMPVDWRLNFVRVLLTRKPMEAFFRYFVSVLNVNVDRVRLRKLCLKYGHAELRLAEVPPRVEP